MQNDTREEQSESDIYCEKLNKISDKLSEYILTNFDIKKEKIDVKYHHTFRVKDVNDEITASLNLSERDKYVSAIIALFHDYARFDQATIYDTFNDLTSRDHGDWAVEKLFDNNEIENFVDDLTDEEKLVVKLAIKNHNKFSIEDGLTDRQNLFCKIIRDADKVDIIHIFATEPRNFNLEIGSLKQYDYDNFMAHKLYVKTKDYDFYGATMLHLSLIFDINFKQSFKIIKKEKYIQKYLYTVKLAANFKLEDRLIECFSHAEKYVSDMASGK